MINLVPLTFRSVNHKALCAHVVAKPEVKRRSVLVKGSSQISKAWRLLGGQTQPIAIDGAKLTWKKAQKKAKKNKISETINKAIPYRKPWRTTKVWCPASDSIKTEINQIKSTNKKDIQPHWNKRLSKQFQ